MYKDYIPTVLKILDEAAKMISNGFFSTIEVENKEDGSPVTNVDKAVDVYIRNELAKAFPGYGFLTEESKDDLSRLEKEYVWVVDPIDGTEEFIKKEYEFTTNIALVHRHEVVLAFIGVPLKNEVYYAYKDGGAYLKISNQETRIHVSNKSKKDLIVLVSPFHDSGLERMYLDRHASCFKEIRKAGAAYKACLIASGKADVTYRFSCHNKEWDTAAPDLLVKEAGGYLFGGLGDPITYNKEDVVNHHGYVIVNRKENFFLG